MYETFQLVLDNPGYAILSIVLVSVEVEGQWKAGLWEVTIGWRSRGWLSGAAKIVAAARGKYEPR